MHALIPLNQALQTAPGQLGGKAAMLARLQQAGFPVPDGYCLPASVYQEFLAATGLADFIAMELQRKNFTELRWEEVWDVSLRIRNHFVTAAWPAALHQALLEDLQQGPAAWGAVAVRSSAPGEDAARQSFAGLHQSRVMVRGASAMLEAIRQVWASLWSDGALLYRQELELDPATSEMAVIIQEMIVGEQSGVLFSRAPQDAGRAMIEAVWGLNQALVDGTLEPDRWQLDRASGAVIEKHRARHTMALRPTAQGTELAPLAATEANRSPISAALATQLLRVGLQLEARFDTAVDLEWTVRQQQLHILQVRPITTGRQPEHADQRPWYLSLHRSLPSLERLQDELEQLILPGMAADAEAMARTDPTQLDDAALAAEIARRRELLQRWLATYRAKCIPMAHGLRLFGEFFNETLRPEDPYAFLELLRSDQLLAVERNRQLLAMARRVREDPALLLSLQQREWPPADGALRTMIETFQARFGRFDWIAQGDFDLSAWLVKLAMQPDSSTAVAPPAGEAAAFLDRLPQEMRPFASRLLAVARASYALRDNDNLYLGKVRAGVLDAEQEARKRLAVREIRPLRALMREATRPEALYAAEPAQAPDRVGQPLALPRQLIGQPAGPGVACGAARVLLGHADLREFQAGDVLVCDAIEPNMTFLVPLAAAIVERRGGMLIHGAIIAREYGIPCVTGIPEATKVIKAGDQISVDGFLGIVTLERSDTVGGS